MTSRGAVLALGLFGCSGQLDAGFDSPHGALPVDERSAMVIVNDGPRDNWQAEYASVLASSGRVKWVGMVVNSSPIYPTLVENVTGFRSLVEAARSSGMQGIPDVTASVSPILVRPATGVIEDTAPNRSEGARLILDAAQRYGSAAHPLVIATGPGTELRRPLGITIIGGLLVSQILTLYTTPVIYLLIDRLRLRWRSEPGAVAAPAE